MLKIPLQDAFPPPPFLVKHRSQKGHKARQVGGSKFYVFVAGRGYSNTLELGDEFNILAERQVTGKPTATLINILTT